MQADLFVAIWLVLLGPVAGSYVAALADRHCRGLPKLYGRSACRACGETIAAKDLVPLLSYPLLGGRCRTCGAGIGRALWAAECAGLVLATLAVLLFPETVDRMLVSLFFFCLLGLFLSDRTGLQLPNALTLPLFGLGLAIGVVLRDGMLWQVLAAGLFGGGLMWGLAWIYRRLRGREGLGFGDVKLVAAVTAALGLSALPQVTLTAASMALVVELVRSGGARGLDRSRAIPFGSYLAVAAVLVILMRLP